jgi:hypothetical protein
MKNWIFARFLTGYGYYGWCRGAVLSQNISKSKYIFAPIGKRITLYNCVFFSYEKLSPP